MNDQMKKIFNNGRYKAWTLGNGLLTAQSGKFNYVMLRYRRPTGTIAWTMKLVNSIYQRATPGSFSYEQDTTTTVKETKPHRQGTKDLDLMNVDQASQKSSGGLTLALDEAKDTHFTTSASSSLRSSDLLSKTESKLSISPTLFDHENFLKLVHSPLSISEHLSELDSDVDSTAYHSEGEEEVKPSTLSPLAKALAKAVPITSTRNDDDVEGRTRSKKSLPQPINNSRVVPIQDIKKDRNDKHPIHHHIHHHIKIRDNARSRRSSDDDEEEEEEEEIDDEEEEYSVILDQAFANDSQHFISPLPSYEDTGKSPPFFSETSLKRTASSNLPKRIEQLPSMVAPVSNKRHTLHNIESLKPLKLEKPAEQVNKQKTMIEPSIPPQSHQDSIPPNFPYLFLRDWPFLSKEEPRGLKFSEALTRALNMIDYIPSYETTKFALLYVSEGQKKEEQILSNTHGSPRYFEFLRELGEFVSLQEQRQHLTRASSLGVFADSSPYTGGLDMSESLLDGEYALMYRDDICHIVFHVATLMPNLPSDQQCSNKKKHIGNDYVTIVYSDYGHPFDVNTITGQFNIIHIVIYPLEEGFNRVEVKLKQDSNMSLPAFGPLTQAQIVSDHALSGMVRLTAMHADMAARAWRKKQYGEFVSNWEERLRQIHVIKQRFSKKSEDEHDKLEQAMSDLFED
jgi:hypothetical protein